MTVKPGDTFLCDPSLLGTTGGKHLWIVVSVFAPDYDTTCVMAVLVNATSMAPGADPTCVLKRGDHGFITHDSYIWYQKAQDVEVSRLAAFKPDTPVSDELLKRIQRGFHQSKYSKRGLRQYVPNP